nr:unnamed protein product [Digitaria exilis]
MLQSSGFPLPPDPLKSIELVLAGISKGVLLNHTLLKSHEQTALVHQPHSPTPSSTASKLGTCPVGQWAKDAPSNGAGGVTGAGRSPAVEAPASPARNGQSAKLPQTHAKQRMVCVMLMRGMSTVLLTSGPTQQKLDGPTGIKMEQRGGREEKKMRKEEEEKGKEREEEEEG